MHQGVTNLQYTATSAVRMMVHEEGGQPQCFTQPVQHMDFQLCTSWTGGLFTPNTHMFINAVGITSLFSCIDVFAFQAV